MPITQVQNSKANVKKLTTNDQPFAPAQPVANLYTGVSTAGQNAIANLGFSVDSTTPANFLLIVDGKILTQGTGNDYTFSGIAADGTSSSIALNTTLPAGLNIQAIKLGLKKESEFLTDNRFTSLYEAQQNGFQAFINQTTVNNSTTTTGTPVAGTFQSIIPNRAAMVDLTQDLKPRMGVERLPVQQLSLLTNEFGPNGEPVLMPTNDQFGQMRFIGPGWQSTVGVYGPLVSTATVNDSFEVTFYGTGLNLLTAFNGGANCTLAAYVDGVLNTSNFNPTGTYSGVLGQRNYAANQPIAVVSGLTLGIHTVRMVQTAVTSQVFNVYGVEVINNSSNVITLPGVAYNAGKKIQLAAASSIAYNSLVTGTRGGRVLQYLTAAGTIGQLFQPTNAAAATLTSADHTNEEIARRYNFREFGIGGSTDFAASSIPSSAAFTLDDGSTTLTALNSLVDPNVGINALTVTGTVTTNYITFTFVGTGLDLLLSVAIATNARAISVSIDGAAAVQITSVTSSQTLNAVYKVASGLAYGTHTCTFTTPVTTGNPIGIAEFIVYQPKTPTLPAGAIALGTYNVMANYVAGSGNGTSLFSTGLLEKCSVRELSYSGTWTATINTVNSTGWQVNSSATGSFVEYTFFGTGFEMIGTWNGSAVASVTVQIDGAAYTGAATVSSANGSWTAGTSTFAISASTGASLQIQGLTLGEHKIRFTTVNANPFYVNSFGIITPIHSVKANNSTEAQSGLAVGSQGIADQRQTSPLKGVLTKSPKIATAVGIISQPSTNSTVFVPMPDMTIPMFFEQNTFVDLNFIGNVSNATSTNTALAFFMDGVQITPASNTLVTYNANNIGSSGLQGLEWPVFVPAGYHVFETRWSAPNGATTQIQGVARLFTLKEIR